jgi:hypothetical protein
MNHQKTDSESSLKTADDGLYTEQDSTEEQLYQSFSPFDLSEILSQEAETIERRYNGNRSWKFWEDQNERVTQSNRHNKKRNKRYI